MFGLLWEHIEDNYDYSKIWLEEDKQKSIVIPETQKHMLINGDNLKSLNLLKQDFKGKIKMIYVDPPYNTGNKKFIYNDCFLNHKNEYAHSDWLEFMYRRLSIAHQLLQDDGFMFLSIDDHEFAHLKLLCDMIFGESNFVTTFCWIMTSEEIDSVENEVRTLGANIGMLKHSHEYILCYRKSSSAKFSLLKSSQEFIESRLTNKGNKISRLTLPKGIPCESKISRTIFDKMGGVSEQIKIVSPNGLIIKDGFLAEDVVLEGCFRNPNMINKFLSGEDVFDLKGQKMVGLYLKKTGVPFSIKEKGGNIPSSIISGYGDTSKWTNHVLDVLDIPLSSASFDYPKPIPLMEYLMEIACPQSEQSIVLDLFAGSGSLGEAVFNLNHSKGFNLASIMLQNNDSNICTSITYPRLRNVITGYLDKSTASIVKVPQSLSYYEVKEKE